jgi:RsiW-degrading membrane proteinase PrsW (M82 family)
MNTALSFFVPVIPTILLAGFFWSRERHREPRPILWATFLFGTLGAVLAAPISILLGLAFQRVEAPWAVGVASAFLSAAAPEEACKFLVIILYCARCKDFEEPLDGVVCGAIAGLGFATLEGVLCVLQGGWMQSLVHVLTSLPLHAFLGAILGYYIDIARFQPDGRDLRLALQGLGLATLLHGLYDLPLMTVLARIQTDPAANLAPRGIFGIPALFFFSFMVLVIVVAWGLQLLRRLRTVSRT